MSDLYVCGSHQAVAVGSVKIIIVHLSPVPLIYGLVLLKLEEFITW